MEDACYLSYDNVDFEQFYPTSSGLVTISIDPDPSQDASSTTTFRGVFLVEGWFEIGVQATVSYYNKSNDQLFATYGDDGTGSNQDYVGAGF